MDGKDILGIAPTGTGKTLAFLLPAYEKLSAFPGKGIKTLILCPTRELALQIHQSALQLASNTKIKSTVVYGGVNKKSQVQQIKQNPQILIACPGRLLDHISDRKVNLSGVETLIVDEADRMCDMGFIDDIEKILKYLPKKRQSMFFAATFQKEIRYLADSFLNEHVTVQIGKIKPVKTVSHSIYPVIENLKKRIIIELLETTPTGQVIIFVRTKHKAAWLAKHLSKNKYKVVSLHGNMTQNRRQQSIDAFRNGKYDFLVATDVASRGIDITGISHVINFDMPNNADDYIHRIGRTGRAENVGEAISLFLEDDEYVLSRIEKTLGNSIIKKQLDGFDYEGFEPLKSKSKQVKPRLSQNRKPNFSNRNRFKTKRKTNHRFSNRKAKVK